MIHASRTLQSYVLLGEGINSGSHTYIHFWPHKDMEVLLEWGMSSMPGPPLRQHEHKRRYTPFTHPFILTRRMWKDDYDGQMIFGDLVGLKLPDICLTGEENTQKKLTQETCPGRGSNPLRDRRACYRLLHSGGQYCIVFININGTFFLVFLLILRHTASCMPVEKATNMKLT